MFVEHDAIWRIIRAQRSNAQLSGSRLLAAADQLLTLSATTGSTVFAFDLAGERIIGAALARSDSLDVFDSTSRFPEGSGCLLVGGFVAGSAGIDSVTKAVIGAGASHVEVAMLSEWSEPMANVRGFFKLGDRVPARVA